MPDNENFQCFSPAGAGKLRLSRFYSFTKINTVWKCILIRCKLMMCGGRGSHRGQEEKEVVGRKPCHVSPGIPDYPRCGYAEVG
jgi:hypothetical protein